MLSTYIFTFSYIFPTWGLYSVPSLVDFRHTQSRFKKLEYYSCSGRLYGFDKKKSLPIKFPQTQITFPHLLWSLLESHESRSPHQLTFYWVPPWQSPTVRLTLFIHLCYVQYLHLGLLQCVLSKLFCKINGTWYIYFSQKDRFEKRKKKFSTYWNLLLDYVYHPFSSHSSYLLVNLWR